MSSHDEQFGGNPRAPSEEAILRDRLAYDSLPSPRKREKSPELISAMRLTGAATDYAIKAAAVFFVYNDFETDEKARKQHEFFLHMVNLLTEIDAKLETAFDLT